VANLVLAFGELLVGAVVLEAAIKGDSIANVIRGQATMHPVDSGSSSSSTTGGGSSTTGPLSGSYTNPVPGSRTGRVDQGVDYALGPLGFLAPGRSKIVYIGSGSGLSGWGNEYVAGQLLDGPLAGAIWYIAEAPAIAPGIVKDAIVNAGQQITPQGSSTGGAIEAGWADPSNPGNPLARSISGYSGDQSLGALTAGWSFSRFVQAVGGLAGQFEGAGTSLEHQIQQEFTGSVSGVPYS
jgi:hypothetical protein